MGLKQANEYDKYSDEASMNSTSKENDLTSNFLDTDVYILTNESFSNDEEDNNLIGIHIDNDECFGTDSPFSNDEEEQSSTHNTLDIWDAK